MSRTATDQALLTTCLQDLYAGCSAFSQRYPSVAQHAVDPALRSELANLTGQASQRAKQLGEIEGVTDGPENLWMAGILDDADRDVRTIAQGRHLDIALIGGVRKALVADLVSVETAIALADTIGESGVAALLRESRALLANCDVTLATLLAHTA